MRAVALGQKLLTQTRKTRKLEIWNHSARRNCLDDDESLDGSAHLLAGQALVSKMATTI